VYTISGLALYINEYLKNLWIHIQDKLSWTLRVRFCSHCIKRSHYSYCHMSPWIKVLFKCYFQLLSSENVHVSAQSNSSSWMHVIKNNSPQAQTRKKTTANDYRFLFAFLKNFILHSQFWKDLRKSSNFLNAISDDRLYLNAKFNKLLLCSKIFSIL